MKIDGIELKYDEVPARYAPCFNQGCPRAGKCLRYAVGQCAPSAVGMGRCVFPASATAAGGCPYFRPQQTLRMAWGFKPLFQNVLARHSAALHHRLYSYFGSNATYCRYNTGQYRLSPQQQQEVRKIFAQYGYDTENIPFAHYQQEIDFSE